MNFHKSHDDPAAVPQLVLDQSSACAKSSAAPAEFADREAYYAAVRRGVAMAADEVVES